MTLVEAVLAPFAPPQPHRACWDWVRQVYRLAYGVELPEYPGHVRDTATPEVVEGELLPGGWETVPMAERRPGDIVWSVPDAPASSIHVGILLDRRRVAHYAHEFRVDSLSSPALYKIRRILRWRG